MQSLTHGPLMCPCGHWRFLPTLALAAGLAAAGSQVSAGDVSSLKSSNRLDEQLPAGEGKLPVFVTAERMSGRPDLESVLEGDVVLRKAGTVIHADRIELS